MVVYHQFFLQKQNIVCPCVKLPSNLKNLALLATDIQDNDSWIFASKVSIPTQINWEQIVEIDTPPELVHVCTLNDLACLLKSSINLYQLYSNQCPVAIQIHTNVKSVDDSFYVFCFLSV